MVMLPPPLSTLIFLLDVELAGTEALSLPPPELLVMA
jgi:hypothetical protein